MRAAIMPCNVSGTSSCPIARVAIREVLTSSGRTLAQGALAWIWARSEKTVPIPGFKTVKQVGENCRAMEFGPLTPEQMKEIDRLLAR